MLTSIDRERPTVGDTSQWGMVGALAIAGALFGAWSSSMIGACAPSRRLERFRALVEAWQILC